MNLSSGESDTLTETNPFKLFSRYMNGEINSSNTSNNLNTNVTEEVIFPPDLVFFGAICMILLATMSMVGNFISVLSLSKSKKLRKVTTAFIVNLCVSDFFLSCSTLENSVATLNTRLWNGGHRSCKLCSILVFYFALISVFTIITITVNRYVLIVHPRYYLAIFCKRNTVIIVGSLWAVSLVLVLLPYFKVWGNFRYDPGSGECSVVDSLGNPVAYNFILAYFVPLILFCACYAKIFYVVRKSERNFTKNEGIACKYVENVRQKYWLEEKKELGEPIQRKLRNRAEWRLFQVILVIFLCFVLCFVPLSALKIARKERQYPHLYILSHLGMHLANVIHPIIYVVMSEDYRTAYKELCWRREENGNCFNK